MLPLQGNVKMLAGSRPIRKATPIHIVWPDGTHNTPLLDQNEQEGSITSSIPK
jgi:hypothetical protein